MKHEQAPTAPKLEGVWFFVYFKYIFYENRYFWPIWQLWVGCFWPKWSKGTFTDQDLSFEPITKSLWPSVQKFWPVPKKYDGQTDGQTDGHPKPIGPQPFGLGPNKIVYFYTVFLYFHIIPLSYYWTVLFWSKVTWPATPPPPHFHSDITPTPQSGYLGASNAPPAVPNRLLWRFPYV